MSKCLDCGAEIDTSFLSENELVVCLDCGCEHGVPKRRVSSFRVRRC